jgi:hypothetical protein
VPQALLITGVTRPGQAIGINPLAYIVDASGNRIFPVQLIDALGVVYKTIIFRLLADGVTWLDPAGAVIASPPAALAAFATATTNYEAKRDAAFGAPGVQAIVTTFA